MGAVLTKCPVTGEDIATGIETDKGSLARAHSLVSLVYCPHCKIEHQWTKETAWVADES
jgi:hypothetical protein